MVLELFLKLHPLIYASQFIHDIIESEKCEKKKKITAIWISQEKELYGWNKKLFIVFEGLSLLKR